MPGCRLRLKAFCSALHQKQYNSQQFCIIFDKAKGVGSSADSLLSGPGPFHAPALPSGFTAATASVHHNKLFAHAWLRTKAIFYFTFRSSYRAGIRIFWSDAELQSVQRFCHNRNLIINPSSQTSKCRHSYRQLLLLSALFILLHTGCAISNKRCHYRTYLLE